MLEFAHVVAETCNTLGLLNLIILTFNVFVHVGALIAIYYYIKDKLFRCRCKGDCQCGRGLKGSQ